jgi:hypothetical protein
VMAAEAYVSAIYGGGSSGQRLFLVKTNGMCLL